MNFADIAIHCFLGNPYDVANFLNPYTSTWVGSCRKVLQESLLKMNLEFEQTCDLDSPSSSCSNSVKGNVVKVRLLLYLMVFLTSHNSHSLGHF